jgi:GrpB-like predicted nucleotidyltransferase (UPF0157 family)
MSKNVVICSDRTGNTFKENVGQLYRELAQLCDDPDDRVFLFAFSHGAFTVRTLAGLLHRCHLPNPGGTGGPDERFEQAFPVRRRAGCACRSRPDRVGFVVAARLVRRHAVTRSGHAADMHPQGHAAAGPVATRPSRPISTGAEPPIGCYARVPVEIYQADPHAAEVAKRLIALIAASWPGALAEHVGSSAVPGLAGKGIIDLLLPADPADLACVTQALFELGFQLQDPQAFPPTRPMLWGVLRHRSNDYRVHVHVVPNSSPEVGAMRGFRDALRADPALRHGYAALKRAIVAGGPVDPVTFTKAKHGWIAAALGQLGLPSGRRLYQDDPAGTAPATGC